VGRDIPAREEHAKAIRRLGRASHALALAAALAATSLGETVLAQPESKGIEGSAAREIEGAVLGLDANDLIIDLGADQGLSEGSVVELWRPLKLKHPVTGKVITERFKIGALEILQARKSVSLATPKGALARPPARGDVIILRREPPKPAERVDAAPKAASPEGGEATPHIDPETNAVMTLLDGLRGTDIPTRVRRYREFARLHPQSRFTRALLEESAALEKLMASTQTDARKKPEARNFKAPTDATASAPLRIGIELSEDAEGAILHARKRGERAYQSYPMTPDGKDYWGATIPAERVVAGTLQFFIEATGPSGKASAVVGDADAPRGISVRATPHGAAERPIAYTVNLTTDYADYNHLRGNDRAWQTEGYFGMRFGDTGVRALRSGFGIYRGIGGSIEELDVLGREGRKVGLTYGYLETEIGFHPRFAVLGRATVGLIDDGISGGGQLLIRIGNDLETNLMLGGELLGGVGLRSMVQLQLEVFPRFPILVRSEVTNQPAGASKFNASDDNIAERAGETGIRAIAQVGMRVTPSLTLAARGSFQGRTIRHAGPGFGAGVSYTW